MGGGLIQLVAYGAQDIHLTGNPQITFFKVVYRRHTNFSIEAIEQVWDGISTKPGKCVSTISRNGDLINRMYLEIDAVNRKFQGNTPAVAINSVELEIGGQLIVSHTGLWMEVWSELTQKNPSGRVAYHNGADSANGTLFQNMSGMGGVSNNNETYKYKYFVPLQFWFCQNIGLSLPLIALQYHEVKVILDHKFGKSTEGSPFSSVSNNTLWCDFIFLDTDERRRYAEVSHEYLIEQVQEQALNKNTAGSSAITSLKFNHPVKELIFTNDEKWIPYETGILAVGYLKPLCTFSSSGTDLDYYLRLNGHDRFEKRDVRYFTRTQIWEHHSGVGGLKDAASATNQMGLINDSIGVYSFSLNPEEYQPSGTCNFSRIDEAEFIVEGSAQSNASRIFAVNYNILRIMSGMGGLGYAN
tara:strand:- start:2124 stop:3362 length:1239 start_codon:yes stop_codon:yes gene_type:complete